MKRKGNVFAVMSSKGGVGKTVTTVNLATALSTEFDKKILVIDTNITTACLGLHFNILYPKITIYDVLRKNFSIGEAIYHYNNNLDIIPASISIEKKDKNFNTMQDNVRRIADHYDILLTQLVKQYDLVLLDSAPGFGTEAIATMQVADGLILVTNPEYPAIVGTAKSLEYAKILKVPMGGIVLNKITKEKYELTPEEIEKALKVKIIKEIPFDKKVPNSIANKTPVVLFDPYCDASIAYKELAASLIKREYSLNFSGKIKRFLRRIGF